MMGAYPAWNLFHYAHDICGIKVAGVLELKTTALREETQAGLLNLFRRGYSITENKKDAVLQLARFIARNNVQPFTVSYIGKSRFRVYLPKKSALECKDALDGTRELAELLRKQHLKVEEVKEVAGEMCVSMHMHISHDKEDKGAQLQDRLGALRYILTGFCERDEVRRRVAVRTLEDPNGVIRGVFTETGRIPK